MNDNLLNLFADVRALSVKAPTVSNEVFNNATSAMALIANKIPYATLQQMRMRDSALTEEEYIQAIDNIGEAVIFEFILHGNSIGEIADVIGVPIIYILKWISTDNARDRRYRELLAQSAEILESAAQEIILAVPELAARETIVIAKNKAHVLMKRAASRRALSENHGRGGGGGGGGLVIVIDDKRKASTFDAEFSDAEFSDVETS